jgi:hypothetical protein
MEYLTWVPVWNIQEYQGLLEEFRRTTTSTSQERSPSLLQTLDLFLFVC